MTKQEIYRIRAHHGLCTAFFKGKGYDEKFTAHMAEIMGRLRENPRILLAEEADEICSCCPHCQSGICLTADKVKGYDRKVIELCGLKAGDIISWDKFCGLVAENIIVPGKRTEVCGDCQWSHICR